MRLKLLAITLLAYAGSGCATATGPLIKSCITDVQRGNFSCYDEKSRQPSILQWGEETDGFICRSPADDKALMLFLRVH